MKLLSLLLWPSWPQEDARAHIYSKEITWVSSESIRNDYFSFVMLAIVLRARNLWSRVLSALKVRINVATVQTWMILYCFKTLHSGYFLNRPRVSPSLPLWAVGSTGYSFGVTPPGGDSALNIALCLEVAPKLNVSEAPKTFTSMKRRLTLEQAVALC
jgi:hypothetical protein